MFVCVCSHPNWQQPKPSWWISLKDLFLSLFFERCFDLGRFECTFSYDSVTILSVGRTELAVVQDWCTLWLWWMHLMTAVHDDELPLACLFQSNVEDDVQTIQVRLFWYYAAAAAAVWFWITNFGSAMCIRNSICHNLEFHKCIQESKLQPHCQLPDGSDKAMIESPRSEVSK